jgi:hypothetical protein
MASRSMSGAYLCRVPKILHKSNHDGTRRAPLPAGAPLSCILIYVFCATALEQTGSGEFLL